MQKLSYFSVKVSCTDEAESTSYTQRVCRPVLLAWDFFYEVIHMETRNALIGIIVADRNESGKLNEILHAYGQYIVGRMGVPYKDKHVNVISIIVDAPQDVISALSGKIGKLDGVSAKTAYSNVVSLEERL